MEEEVTDLREAEEVNYFLKRIKILQTANRLLKRLIDQEVEQLIEKKILVVPLPHSKAKYLGNLEESFQEFLTSHPEYAGSKPEEVKKAFAKDWVNSKKHLSQPPIAPTPDSPDKYLAEYPAHQHTAIQQKLKRIKEAVVNACKTSRTHSPFVDKVFATYLQSPKGYIVIYAFANSMQNEEGKPKAGLYDPVTNDSHVPYPTRRLLLEATRHETAIHGGLRNTFAVNASYDLLLAKANFDSPVNPIPLGDLNAFRQFWYSIGEGRKKVREFEKRWHENRLHALNEAKSAGFLEGMRQIAEIPNFLSLSPAQVAALLSAKAFDYSAPVFNLNLLRDIGVELDESMNDVKEANFRNLIKSPFDQNFDLSITYNNFHLPYEAVIYNFFKVYHLIEKNIARYD